MYTVIGADGKRYGPVDLDSLKRWCLEGRVLPGSQVTDPVSGLDVPAQSLPELAETFFNMSTRPAPIQAAPMPSAPVMQPQSPYPLALTPRKRSTAILMAVFVGWLGLHRFYLGYRHIGAAQAGLTGITVLTNGCPTIVAAVLWGWADAVLIARGELGDRSGAPLEP